MARLMIERRRPASRPTPPGDETTGTSTVDAPSTLDEDAVFDVLRAGRRRIVLRYLHEHGGEAGVGALAEHVAAAENGLERGSVAPSQRKRAYVALYQNHLPKLETSGAIEYDRETAFVELREPSRPLLAYLYFEPDSEPRRAGSGCGIRALLRCVQRLVRR